MRIEEWEFATAHPAYERPRQDTRWIAPLPGMRPRAYKPYVPPKAPMPTEGITEPLAMWMEGFPSADIHQTATGNTVQTVRLHSRWAQQMDLTPIRNMARLWYEGLRRLSRGPYSLEMLRRMGHPYGYGERGAMPSWRRLSAPRQIPGFKGKYRRGARGFVTNRAVINRQSGQLEQGWRFSVLPWHGGVTLNFWNEAKSKTGAPYPWFLSHGTYKMQAHGPWPYVANELMPSLHAAWRKGAQEAARAARDKDAQFGAEKVAAQEAEREAGGFL